MKHAALILVAIVFISGCSSPSNPPANDVSPPMQEGGAGNPNPDPPEQNQTEAIDETNTTSTPTESKSGEVKTIVCSDRISAVDSVEQSAYMALNETNETIPDIQPTPETNATNETASWLKYGMSLQIELDNHDPILSDFEFSACTPIPCDDPTMASCMECG